MTWFERYGMACPRSAIDLACTWPWARPVSADCRRGTWEVKAGTSGVDPRTMTIDLVNAAQGDRLSPGVLPKGLPDANPASYGAGLARRPACGRVGAGPLESGRGRSAMATRARAAVRALGDSASSNWARRPGTGQCPPVPRCPPEPDDGRRELAFQAGQGAGDILARSGVRELAGRWPGGVRLHGAASLVAWGVVLGYAT